MPDVEFAHAVLVLGVEPVDDMPILDLRIRKGVRRHHVKLCVATSRPSSLDANAAAVARYAPGAEEAFAAALGAALAGGDGLDELAARGGRRRRRRSRALARVLAGAGEDVVIVWGERLTGGPRDAHAVARAAQPRRPARRARPRRRRAARRPGDGQRPRPARGRRAAQRRPGPVGARGRRPRRAADRPGGRRRRARRAVPAAAPTRSRRTPTARCGSGRWAARRPSSPTPQFLTDGVREHATIVFPAESGAEKEGTVTHPDGRVQRLRPAIAHPGDVRAEWQVHRRPAPPASATTSAC